MSPCAVDQDAENGREGRHAEIVNVAGHNLANGCVRNAGLIGNIFIRPFGVFVMKIVFAEAAPLGNAGYFHGKEGRTIGGSH